MRAGENWPHVRLAGLNAAGYNIRASPARQSLNSHLTTLN